MIESPAGLRSLVRSGQWRGPTAGLLPGHQQANLAVLPARDAYDFLLYCVRNPQVCPVLWVSDPGDPIVPMPSGDADLRTDLPRYRVWQEGVEIAEQPTDVAEWWDEDLVAFLLGCSHTFEGPLADAGHTVRRSPDSPAPPVFVTNRPTRPAGRVHGPLAVSMRSFPAAEVDAVVRLTSTYPTGHGAPVHIGDPSALGIHDLAAPDFGPRVPVPDGDVPMFWACGVTPQLVLPRLRSRVLITHSAGHMFVFDDLVERHRVSTGAEEPGIQEA